jgi:folate-binding protein YgfZ
MTLPMTVPMTPTFSDRAVPGTGVDAGVPWHYGDPLREQRVLETGAGVVDRGNRDVLTVTGPDRLDWLHTICSQHLSALHDGDSTEALVLSPHGHVEQHWQLTDLDGTVWLDTEPGSAADVLGYLEKMRFLKRVELADVSAGWSVLSVLGPAAADTLVAARLPVPEVARAEPLPDGGFVRRNATGAVDLLVPQASAASTTRALVAAGAQPAGMWAYEAERVVNRRPRLRFETDHRTIPHEVGWIGTAVHLNKGCYRGQETVARVNNLGRPPRRLVLVHLAGEADDLPAAGTEILLSGRTVGFLGTAVHHWELGPVALAVVKRSVPDDAALSAAGTTLRIDPTSDGRDAGR